MAYKILFTENALADLEIILDYVLADNPGAAERFGASLLNYIELLESFPRIGVPYYRLLEDRSLIEILPLWHGPGKTQPSDSAAR